MAWFSSACGPVQSVDLRSTIGISMHQHCPVVAPHIKDLFVSGQVFWVPPRMSCFCRVFDIKSFIVGVVGSLGLICDGCFVQGFDFFGALLIWVRSWCFLRPRPRILSD